MANAPSDILRINRGQHAMFPTVRRYMPAMMTSNMPSLKPCIFDDACSDHFKCEGDFWDCIVRSVAQAAKKHPLSRRDLSRRAQLPRLSHEIAPI
jgi:hypothetical protein